MGRHLNHWREGTLQKDHLIYHSFPTKGKKEIQHLNYLIRIRFFNKTDIPENPLLQAASSTMDLMVSITSHSSSSLCQTLLPSIEIKISYSQALFSEKRINQLLNKQIIVSILTEQCLRKYIIFFNQLINQLIILQIKCCWADINFYIPRYLWRTRYSKNIKRRNIIIKITRFVD